MRPKFTRETKQTKFGLAHKTCDGRWRVYQGRRISKNTGKSVPFYAYLSRLVWEDERGPIPVDYEVHHGPGGKDDDRIENLLCVSKPKHIEIHRYESHFFIDGIEMKHCAGGCDRDLPISSFNMSFNSVSPSKYYRSNCKQCQYAYVKEWRRIKKCERVAA
jgi:hypothetical protein